MATVPSTSNILFTTARVLLAGVLVLVVFVGVFFYALPFALEHGIDYPSDQTEGASPSGTSTATPIVVTVQTPPFVAAPSAPAVVVDAPSRQSPAGPSMQEARLGDRLGSGEVPLSPGEAPCIPGTGVIEDGVFALCTGSGQRPTGRECRTDPVTGERVCRQIQD